MAKKKPDEKDPFLEDPAVMAVWEQAMTPGRGHKRLEPLVGTFEATSEVWMAPGAPTKRGHGVSRQRWVLGGRFLQQIYRGKTMGLPLQGIGYTGYDNAQKRYVGVWMDTMGTGIMHSVGETEPTARKLDFTSTVTDFVTGKTAKLRSIVRIRDRDHHTFEMWSKDPTGKEFRSLRVEYTRR